MMMSDFPSAGRKPLPIICFSTDFLVGATYDSDTTKAYDEIVKYEDGLRYFPRKQWLDLDAAKTEAERSYRNGNCCLIQ